MWKKVKEGAQVNSEETALVGAAGAAGVVVGAAVGVGMPEAET
jgi:hypothetical protein